MSKELPKVYVYKPTREEVAEIVNRILENGGIDYDTLGEWEHDEYDGWGCIDITGKRRYASYTYNIGTWEDELAKRVTMDEFRKLFPSKSDVVSDDKSEKQKGAMLEALKELAAAYRRLGGLECALDKELLVAEAIIKKMEVGDEN